MLPVIFSGISGSVISANVYGTTGFMADQGFEDTWMIIGGLARALVRGVDVYVLLSAPCSFGANDPDAAGLDGGDMCPIDGSPPSGFNLWSQVVEDHGGFWPSSTEYPSSIPEKRSRARKLGGKDASETSLTRNHRQLTYGYGWTLENTADWIFAYLAIHPEERPQSAHGRAAANELINLICKRAHIAHVRVAASEATYGTRADGTQVRMTQIGNHAKVIMADDSAFYMGSNNAYGAGLAEFGLIVDDAEKARELDNNYYSPLWQQAKAGAVSGSDAIGCPWGENLWQVGSQWTPLNIASGGGRTARGLRTQASVLTEASEVSCRMWARTSSGEALTYDTQKVFLFQFGLCDDLAPCARYTPEVWRVWR